MGLFDEAKDRIADLVHRAPILHIAADEGEGSVVVLLHGIASSASTFELVIPDEVPTSRLPTPEELRLLGEVIDPKGTRLREVPEPE